MQWVWGDDQGCWRAWRLVCQLTTYYHDHYWLPPERRAILKDLLNRADTIMWQRIAAYQQQQLRAKQGEG